MMNIKEAAAYLGYSVRHFRRMIARGDVRSFQARPGGIHSFKKEWLDSFIAKHTHYPIEQMPTPRRNSRRKPIKDFYA